MVNHFLSYVLQIHRNNRKYVQFNARGTVIVFRYIVLSLSDKFKVSFKFKKGKNSA
jgi:hypothetical protein